MKGLKCAVLIWAIFPIVTGAMDIVLGAQAWSLIGMSITESSYTDAVLDSQVRFIGTLWLGYGVLLCICASNLKRYEPILRAALWLVIVGGVARLVSVAQVGWSENALGNDFVVFALLIEFVVMPALLFYQHKVMSADREFGESSRKLDGRKT